MHSDCLSGISTGLETRLSNAFRIVLLGIPLLILNYIVQAVSSFSPLVGDTTLLGQI